MTTNNRDRNRNIEPRLASLETSVEAITADLRDLVRAVDVLRSSMVDGKRPQWGNLISAIGVAAIIVGAIGSAFINPLTIQLNTHERLLIDNDNMHEIIKDRLRQVESDVSANKQLITSEFAATNRTLEDVRVNGSVVTRERLAILESALKIPLRLPPIPATGN